MKVLKQRLLTKVKGDPKNPNHISATMPGTVIKVVVEKGEKVEKGDHLLITEAMKMETTVQAPFYRSCKRYLCSRMEKRFKLVIY